MTLTHFFHQLKHRFLEKFRSNFSNQLLTLISIIVIFALFIWFAGPYLNWHAYEPFLSVSQRIYAIAALCLLGFLKYIIFDHHPFNPFYYKDIPTRKKLLEIKKRFQGALDFLNKNAVIKNNKNVSLAKLPWYLLIGPMGAGKTSLLANANINYILQKQFPRKKMSHLEPSDHCDWWVMRQMSMIDVPGKYLPNPDNKNLTPSNLLWNFFLRLVKKSRGKDGLDGIVIALPADLLIEGEVKHLETFIQGLVSIKKEFTSPIDCHFIITKSDLIPGFLAFFAELNLEDYDQAWGVTFPIIKNPLALKTCFADRFNILIKKLNQQLIFRLHQERNVNLRHHIKDFPLQIEKIKDGMLKIIDQCINAETGLRLSSVYLTSALQKEEKNHANIFDAEAIQTQQKAIQLFKEPTTISKSYFIKPLLNHLFTINKIDIQYKTSIKTKLAYVFSISIISLMTFLWVKDFSKGVKQIYAYKQQSQQYQIEIAKNQNENTRLTLTLNLLKTLQSYAKNTELNINFTNLLNFYSQKSQLKATNAYHNALQNILLPEIRDSFSAYLNEPFNKDPNCIYAVLKAYLMLGDMKNFDANYVASIFNQYILPKNEASELKQFAITALNTLSKPLPLDDKLIRKSRTFLSAIPLLDMSYLILVNMDNNNVDSGIHLVNNNGLGELFEIDKNHFYIPNLFTTQYFKNIYSQVSLTAAQETLSGNWILGEKNLTINPSQISTLQQALQKLYVQKYREFWETELTQIHFATINNLTEANTLLVKVVSNNSPLLQLLQTIHDNTFFEPIESQSSTLKNLGQLVDQINQPNNLLFQLFFQLQTLHQDLSGIVASYNEKKAAFDKVTKQLNEPTNSYLALQTLIEQTPSPLKDWLSKTQNETDQLLKLSASQYLNDVWQSEVMEYYSLNIKPNYPFNIHSTHEVDLKKFAEFFGNPGIFTHFYNQYLIQLIDVKNKDWQWKSNGKQTLLFSTEALHQIHQAMRIQQTFFPNGDNKPFIQFTLEPIKLGDTIQSVKFNLNGKVIVDQNKDTFTPHTVAWPNNSHPTTVSSIEISNSNHVLVNKSYVGNWGIFKLVEQNLDSVINAKKLILNLNSTYQTKYALMMERKLNPFITTDMRNLNFNNELFIIQN